MMGFYCFLSELEGRGVSVSRTSHLATGFKRHISGGLFHVLKAFTL